MASNITAAQILDSEIKIVDSTPLRVVDTVGGLGNLAGIRVGGVSIGGIGTLGTGGRGTGPAIVIPGAGDEGGDAVAFDAMLDEVRPGDLITSDFMMRLLARINRLEAAARKLSQGGEVGVPDLFGQQLSKVAAAVQKSDGKLKLGLVLDVLGQKIDPKDAGARVVLGQHPAPGDEVDKGTELNLLVSFPARGDQESGTGGSTGGGVRVAGIDFIERAGNAVRTETQPAGGLERVTDETIRPAAGGGVTGTGSTGGQT